MKSKLKWFILGFLSAVIILRLGTWLNTRPSNAVAKFPQVQQEFMLEQMPWLQSAQGVEIGPFVIVVPSSPSEKAEAVISPKKGFPQILFTKNSIDFVGSKYKIMSVKYSQKSGEITSYDMSSDLLNGNTYFDGDFDGQFDVKTESNQFHVFFETKWMPVVFKDKRKFIELDGDLREIEIKKYVWKFVE